MCLSAVMDAAIYASLMFCDNVQGSVFVGTSDRDNIGQGRAAYIDAKVMHTLL
jgi:hypothetical protein